MNKIIAVSVKTISNLTTPQLLKGSLGFTWVATLLLLVVTLIGVDKQKTAIKTVGKDSTLSIVTAQRLKDAFAGMDAYVANELILPPGQNQKTLKGYQERYEQATKRLVLAAHNITEEDKEQKPIETMQLGFGNYIAKVQQARDFHVRGDTTSVLITYRASAEIMDKILLPASDTLDQVNLEVLNNTYARQNSTTKISLALIFISGAALISVLVVLQLFLSQRMRRTLNPGLLTATTIALGFLLYTIGVFSSTSHQLKVAKEDAFTSMHALRRARSAGYIANAAESRFLLDSALGTKHEKAFFDNINQIVQLPKGKTFEALITAYKSNNPPKIDGLRGLLIDELSNITFGGEKEAVLGYVAVLGKYLDIDQKIRQLERSGKHQEAIALCIGNQPGESNWTFEQLKKTNQTAFNINEKAFNDAIGQSKKELEGFEIKTSVALSAIALLSLVGLFPRLREYSL